MADALPPPPIPLECDLSGMEPPWDLIIEMTAEAFPEVPRTEIEAFTEELRLQHREGRK